MADSAMPGRVDVWLPGHLGVLGEYIPVEAIDEALAQTGTVQQRLRLLPARVVTYFVLALALFPQCGYGRVWDKLVEGVDAPPLPSLAALRQARCRLGVAPVRALWEWMCRALADPSQRSAFYRGWRLLAWDGTTLDVPDTESNQTLFPTARGKQGRSGYRKLTVVGLVECGTRAFLGAVFGRGEITLASQLLDRLTRGHLLLADRGFLSWRLWQRAAERGADLLWRVRANTVLPVTERLADGSYLSQASTANRRRSSTVRVIEGHVTITDTDGVTRVECYRLITTILDPRAAPAQELLELYAHRWSVETTYYCWKTLQQGRDHVLRSKTSGGVRQELYAFLITYQALRALAYDTAHAADLDTRRISFVVTVDTAVSGIIRHHAPATTDPAHQHTAALHRSARRPLPATTTRRSCPRSRKRPVSKFPSKRPGTRASQPVTYTITIQPALTTSDEP